MNYICEGCGGGGGKCLRPARVGGMLRIALSRAKSLILDTY